MKASATALRLLSAKATKTSWTHLVKTFEGAQAVAQISPNPFTKLPKTS
jgi:hypothetical protein